MEILKGISYAKPELGGVLSAITPSVVIAPVKTNRPYILGSAVIGTIATPKDNPTTALIGAGASVLGCMAMGLPQLVLRGRVVVDGYGQRWNNMGTKGAFYVALDLNTFDKDAVDELAVAGVLSVDANGVFSYGAQAQAGNTAVTNVTVLGYRDVVIQPAINETIAVGNQNYVFNYPKGIGALSVILG